MEFDPDWVVAPGETIKDALDERSISPAELVYGGRTAEQVDAVLAGDAPLDLAMAVDLAALTNVSVSFWLALEAQYRDGLARGKART